jgi:hypothetical protein
MTQPTVCAVLLTADRQEMTDRAVRCFLRSDYAAAHLLIFDTGHERYILPKFIEAKASQITVVRPLSQEQFQSSIGALRNQANSLVHDLDVIVHLDSDDWSAPTHISDQVKLLVESGKQAVGYREMLFWQEWRHGVCVECGAAQPGEVDDDKPCWSCGSRLRIADSMKNHPGAAWLYRNTDPRYCLATSLCYWRKTWEEKPFPDAMIGSEREWLKGLDTHAVSGLTAHTHALAPGDTFYALRIPDVPSERDNPAMLATIHGSNTVKNQIQPAAANTDGSPMWTRVPAWDQRVRSILEAA